MSNRAVYNVEYNIPRVNVSFVGRQNRSSDGMLRITPGMSEVFEFIFGNQDGYPITLVPFKIKLVFWQINTLDEGLRGIGQSSIIFAKEVEITEPYNGRVVIKLDDSETTRIGVVSSRSIRWNLFAINDERDVFPMQVNRNGGRDGTVLIDTSSNIPNAELIRSA